jgi:uncharacterized protein YaeQ
LLKNNKQLIPTAMKKILKFGLALSLVLSTISMYADDDVDFLLHVRKGDNKSISFIINRVHEVDLAIYDQDNSAIFNEKATGKEGIYRNYNLEEFPDGIYTLVVESDFKKMKYEFKISNGIATLSTKSYMEVYKRTPIGTFKQSYTMNN